MIKKYSAVSCIFKKSGYLMALYESTNVDCLGIIIRKLLGLRHGFTVHHAASSSAQFAISGFACVVEYVAEMEL